MRRVDWELVALEAPETVRRSVDALVEAQKLVKKNRVVGAKPPRPVAPAQESFSGLSH